MHRRKIAVITSTRADYGILRPLLQKIDQDEALTLELIVTGSHLLQEHGYTLQEIKKDFTTFTKVAMHLSDNTAVQNSIAMAQLQSDMTTTLNNLTPDIVVILGDRFEILSVAISAMMLHIPIAHLHGGELTQGAMDDSIRHAVTKLSHLHFTATQEYAQRVIQMGEEPHRVYNVGALGVENIKNISLMSKEELENSLHFQFQKQNLLVTYHPQTLSKYTPKEQIQTLLDALEHFRDTGIIFTKSNIDEGGEIINKALQKYVDTHPHTLLVDSLGMQRYFSAIKVVDCVVGNSSSGILEVPSFHTPTVDIGERQKGRIYAPSVLKTPLEKQSIIHTINKALSHTFQTTLTTLKNPYEGENTSFQIKEILKKTSLEQLQYKKFFTP
jgi:GDP/UDP-N,N'-diacetylbacillosamine 2-epimerase (hydrolysing)